LRVDKKDQKQETGETLFLPFPTFPYPNFGNYFRPKKRALTKLTRSSVYKNHSFSIFGAKMKILIQTQKLDKTFCEYSKNKSEYQEDWRRNKNHFKSASRREKTKEKKKMCIINCYDCPDCPGLWKLPTRENYFSKRDSLNLKPVSTWSREAVRRWDANLLMDRLLNSKTQPKFVGKIIALSPAADVGENMTLH
jgi:hypothetical protein